MDTPARTATSLILGAIPESYQRNPSAKPAFTLAADPADPPMTCETFHHRLSYVPKATLGASDVPKVAFGATTKLPGAGFSLCSWPASERAWGTGTRPSW